MRTLASAYKGIAVLVLTGICACFNPDPPTGVQQEEGETPNVSGLACTQRCTLLDGDRIVPALSARKDSSDAILGIGSFRIRGASGHRILLLTQTSEPVRIHPGTASLIIETDGVRREFGLGSLPDTIVVAEPRSGQIVAVRYWLKRGLSPVQGMRINFIQAAEGTEVLEARTPWFRSSEINVMAPTS